MKTDSIQARVLVRASMGDPGATFREVLAELEVTDEETAQIVKVLNGAAKRLVVAHRKDEIAQVWIERVDREGRDGTEVVASLADLYRLTPTRIRQILGEKGVRERTPRPRLTRRAQEKVDRKVAATYRRLKTLKATAAATGYSHETVRKILMRQGVERYPPSVTSRKQED